MHTGFCDFRYILFSIIPKGLGFRETITQTHTPDFAVSDTFLTYVIHMNFCILEIFFPSEGRFWETITCV